MVKSIHVMVGQRVRQERLRAKLTIEQLAGLAQISTSFLSYVENRGKPASLDTIHKLALALRIPVAELFKDEPAPPKDELYDAAQQFTQLIRDKKPREREHILDVVRTLSKKRD
ncbi:MAG: helix-turn-helix transcriptional regulator [Elusimicrobia bacterium]|nr:helix-turn-helix transcriptional regulator [Elusimicrobiota bacterium]